MRVRVLFFCAIVLLSTSASAKTAMTLESYNKQIFDFQLRENSS